jgi:PAT family beta-lactamase induction signal transducer AmpG
MAALTLQLFFYLEQKAKRREISEPKVSLELSLQFFQKKKIGFVLAFILLFRLGEVNC